MSIKYGNFDNGVVKKVTKWEGDREYDFYYDSEGKLLSKEELVESVPFMIVD